MLELKIYDANKIELKIGDLVEIYSGSLTRFYSKVQLKDNILHPFDTFSFTKIVKCNKLPSTAKEGIDENFKYWYRYIGEKEPDKDNINKHFQEFAKLRILKEKYYKIFEREIINQKSLF